MVDDILKAIPFGIILAFTVGPVFFVLLETAATKGFASALVFDFGVILADVVFISLAFLSTGGFLDKIKDDPNVLVFGGVLLIVYGIISFIKNSRSFKSIVREYQRVEIQKDYFKMFVKGFLLNFINIGVLLGWLGFIVIGNSITDSKEGAVVFILTILITYLAVDLFKIAIAKQIKQKLTPKRIFKTKKIVSVVILGFGILLLFQGLFPKTYEKNKQRIEQINPLNK
ncbi:MAG TPA: LysE family transporter [Flavobacteriaceae bacterium]|nr:LysE family transporter [Flavobacteriaceae bacterium]